MNSRNKRLAENMLKLIDRRGMTQEDLSIKCGISRVTISYYVNGHIFPKPHNLKKIADALNVDVDELLGNKILSIDEEDRFLECFRHMKMYYPEQTLLIISPDTYRGYNLQTGKKIRLKVVEE